MLNAPCYLCQEKVLYCHSSCEKYKEYREILNSLNEKVNKEKEINQQINQYVGKNIQKHKRKHNLKK